MNTPKPYTSHNALWTREFLLVCASNIVMFFNVHLFFSTFTFYAIARFAVGDAVGGASASIFVIGALISRLAAGPLMEKAPLKLLLVVCFAVFVGLPPFYLATDSITVTMALRIIHGAAFGLGSSVIATLAVARIPSHRLAEGTGYYASSTVVGTALGSFIGLLLLNIASFQSVVWTGTITSAVGLLLLIFMRMPVMQAPAADFVARGWLSRFVEPAALPMALLGALFMMGYSSIVTFVATLGADRNLGSAVSFFFLIYAAAVLISRPFTGPLMDRRGFNVVMVPAFLIFGAGLFTIGQSQSGLMLGLGAVLVGLGQGNLVSGGQTIAISRVPRHKLGMGTSTFFLGIDVGMGVGPFLIGFLVQANGLGQSYMILGAAMIPLLGLYWIMQSRAGRALTN